MIIVIFRGFWRAVVSVQCQVFSKNLDGDGMGNLGWLDGNRGAHGVTRPTNDGPATWLFDFIAHFGVRVKVIIRGFGGKFSAGTPDGADTGRNGREAALDMTTPHPQSLSPLRGEGSQWRRGRASWALGLRA